MELPLLGRHRRHFINYSHYIHFCNSKRLLGQLSLVDDGFFVVP
jgi:hypothetical protein